MRERPTGVNLNKKHNSGKQRLEPLGQMVAQSPVERNDSRGSGGVAVSPQNVVKSKLRNLKPPSNS